MNELLRQGRELLDEARLERTPDLATRERVFRALVASEGLASSARAAPVSVKPLTGLRRWLVLAGVTLALAIALYWAGHAGGCGVR